MSSVGSVKSMCEGDYVSNLLSRHPKDGLIGSAAHMRESTINSDKAGRIKELGKRGLPPYPGVSFIQEIVVPAPALLPKDGEAYDWVRVLAAAYRAGCKHRFGLVNNFMLYGKLGRNKAYPTVLKAAHRMVEFEIAPVAWTLFSFDCWRESVGRDSFGGSPPGVSWTFSSNRLEVRRDWFEDRKEDYSVRRTRVGPKHQGLIQDWNEMWRYLILHNPSDRRGVLKICDGFFPEDSYEKRVVAAKSEVVRMQMEIDRLVSEGGDLWG